MSRGAPRKLVQKNASSLRDAHRGTAHRAIARKHPGCRLSPSRLWVCLAILSGVVMALYLRTLSFEFVFDDWAYIVENPLLKRADSFLYPLRFNDFATVGERDGFDPDLCLNFILRPAAYATMYLNWLFGGMVPAGFRIVNIAIHAANACLLFLLLSRWLKREAHGKAGRPAVGSAGFFAALLFAVHPMQIESVTYITQRFESLATFFFLGTCLSYDHFLRTGLRRWRLASLACLLTGLFSKETVITAPILLVVIDCLLHGASIRSSLWRARHHLAAMLIVPVLITATSWAQNHGTLEARHAINITNVNLDPLTPLEYARTQACASLSYLRLLLWPVGQNADADYPAVSSWLDVRFLTSVSLITLLFTAVAVLFVKRGGTQNRNTTLGLLGLLWFFITLLPSSSFVPLPDLFVEHRSYLPSIGVAIALAAMIEGGSRRLHERHQSSGLLTASLVCIVVVLSVANWRRNEVWRSEISFWQDAASKSRDKARPLQSLGTALAAHGNKRSGLHCLEKAIAIEPRFLPAWVNSILIHLELGEFDAAERTSRAALQLYPDTATLHHNLGMIYAQTGRHVEAIHCFERTLQLQPRTAEAHECLAHIHHRLHDLKKAREHLQAALELNPEAEGLRDLQRTLDDEAAAKNAETAAAGAQ